MSGWGDQVGDGERQRYVPPHMRGMGSPAAPPMPMGAVPGMPGMGGPAMAFGGGGYGGRVPYGAGRGRGGYGGGPGGGYGGGGYGGARGYGGGGYGARERPPWPENNRMEDPFAQDAAIKAESDAVFGNENTGINFDAYEDIPVETSGHDVPPHVDTFEQLELGEALMSNIRRCKYTKPTPVQRYAIPIGLAGRDMMACAQTGSGKTAAFCFPIIAGLLKKGYQPTGRGRKALPAALVLAPTRELTSQIYDEARKFSYQTGIRPVVAYGGAPIVQQVGTQAGACGSSRHTSSTQDSCSLQSQQHRYMASHRAAASAGCLPATLSPHSHVLCKWPC